jgi:N-acetylmuramoyl-L-alanine amidase
LPCIRAAFLQFCARKEEVRVKLPRRFWIHFVVIVVACLPAAVALAAALHSRRIEGGDYVPVSEVAQYYGLGRNASDDRDIARYRELELQSERRDVTLNGVQHWLSAPIYSSQGKLWISSTDVLKALDPVLRQGRAAKPLAVRTIVLDPGHGGNDRGTHGQTGIEKTLTLDLAKRVKDQLDARGFQVYLTRATDRFVPLENRTDFAEQKKADIFVSIHLNSGGNAEGIETFCLPPANAVSTAATFRGWQATRDRTSDTCNRNDEQNVWLAHCVQKSLLQATGANDRGVRRAHFVVIRDTVCPAILVEAGFLTNSGEERKLLNAEHRDRLAKAIAEGVLSYKAGAQKQ